MEISFDNFVKLCHDELSSHFNFSQILSESVVVAGLIEHILHFIKLVRGASVFVVGEAADFASRSARHLR